MNEATLRTHLKTHGDSIVAGKIDQIMDDFTDEVKPLVPQLAPLLPVPLEAAEIVSVQADGSRFIVHIQYRGEGAPVTVESIWEEQGGRPVIVAAKPV